MLFFRSEALLNEWLKDRNAERGATLSVHQLWQLSQRWYHNRLSYEYHGRKLEQIQEIFTDLGLTSGFWS
jgi:hypothetical protein